MTVKYPMFKRYLLFLLCLCLVTSVLADPPNVSPGSPINGATDVSVETQIGINFSVPIDSDSVSVRFCRTVDYELENSCMAENLLFDSSVAPDNLSMSVLPQNPLEYNTSYTVEFVSVNDM